MEAERRQQPHRHRTHHHGQHARAHCCAGACACVHHLLLTGVHVREQGLRTVTMRSLTHQRARGGHGSTVARARLRTVWRVLHAREHSGRVQASATR